MWSRNASSAILSLLPLVDMPVVHVFLVALRKAFCKKVISLPLQTDPNTAFLRAARAGQQEKVIEYLDAGVDINTANAVSEFYNWTWTVQYAWASTIPGRVAFMSKPRISLELIRNSLVLLNPKINHHTKAAHYTLSWFIGFKFTFSNIHFLIVPLLCEISWAQLRINLLISSCYAYAFSIHPIENLRLLRCLWKHLSLWSSPVRQEFWIEVIFFF